MFENFVQDFLFIVNKLEWFFSEFFFSLLGKILVKRFVYVKLYIFMGYEFNSEYCMCKCLRRVLLFCIGEVVQ